MAHLHAVKRGNRRKVNIRDAFVDTIMKTKVGSPSGDSRHSIMDEELRYQPFREHGFMNEEDRTAPPLRFLEFALNADSCQLITSSPTPFIHLPIELRTMVYRQCLLSRTPIDCTDGHFVRHHPFWHRPALKVAGGLLATCKLINIEAREILYGENVFRFFNNCDTLRVTAMLPVHKFVWLKELTISYPANSVPIYVLDDVAHILPGGDDYKKYGEDAAIPGPNFWEGGFTPKQQWYKQCSVQALCLALCQSPNLEKLNIIISVEEHLYYDFSLEYCQYPELNYEGKNRAPYFVIDRLKLWERILGVIKKRPALRVTMIGLVQTEWDLTVSFERFPKRLASLSGVWDVRTAMLDERSHGWETPMQSEADPAEILSEIKNLYN